MHRAIVAASILLLGTAASAQAQESVADFYKGKTVRLIVGIGVGSGYDVNARAARPPPAASTFPAIRTSSCRTSRAPAA